MIHNKIGNYHKSSVLFLLFSLIFFYKFSVALFLGPFLVGVFGELSGLNYLFYRLLLILLMITLLKLSGRISLDSRELRALLSAPER